MQGRLGGGASRAATPVAEPGIRVRVNANQVILGIDPSLRGTGFGVIRLGKPHPLALVHGTISCPVTWPHSRCLVKIAQTLREVLREHRPTVCVVEGLFFAQNLQTAIIMGEARGAAMMVQRLLNLSTPPEPDAADALALALAHAQANGRYSLAAPKRI